MHRHGAFRALEGGVPPALHDDVRLHMADPANAGRMLRFSDVDKGHGRIEIREASVCHEVDALQDLHHWPGLQAVGKVTATREIKGRRSTETHFFLLSERLDPERFLRTVRSHWAVENSLHWVLDVTMGEDGLRNRRDNGPENLALMRKLALNLARLTDGGRVKSMRGKLKKAGWDDRFLLKLVSAASLFPSMPHYHPPARTAAKAPRPAGATGPDDGERE